MIVNRHHRNKILCLAALTALTMAGLSCTQSSPKGTSTDASVAAQDSASQRIAFEQETLPNGLKVIYAPLKTAPVVHVRVLYHVGSKDERADRQGFAHMFEHMMFRGSAHVAPEEHMKLIGVVGGISNAFTSFDQTTYHDTVPSNHTEMALYLEADRMASFKVNEQIYKTERNVVAKEWGIRQNQPYGTMFEDFLKTSYTRHSYQWSPIGNMDHLKSAPVNELQDFYNTYYVPNNATLIVAGDIDVAKTRELVKKYYAWIPRGADVKRRAQPEPEQTEARRVVLPRPVPLASVIVGWRNPAYTSPDHPALQLLGSILGDGRSSRLDQALVNSDPTCMTADAGSWQLEDASVFTVSARVLQGKDPQAVEAKLKEIVAGVVANGVTASELEKAKTQARIAIVKGRETCTNIATQLGEESTFGGDAARVNAALADVEAVTLADIHRVAKTYLQPQKATVLQYQPDATGKAARAAATQVAALANSTPASPTEPIKGRDVNFPAGYPQHPPMALAAANPIFAKGQELEVGGVKVIVMSDHRLPLANFSLTMRRGGHVEPKGKEGLASLTAALLRRGSGTMSFAQINEDLESRGISVEASDGGDFTRLGAACTADQLEHAVDRARMILREPAFPADEFAKLKTQTLNGLQASLANPTNAAEREVASLLFGDTAQGRSATPESVASITLDDVKAYYKSVYRPDQAIVIFSGDVSVEKGRALAAKLLADWPNGDLPKADYALPPAPDKRTILLIDNPDGKQSILRLAVRGYDIRSPEKFAGSLAGQILSAGIDSRLGKYVRAEKGYVYGVGGYFRPGRHSGYFNGMTETAFDTTGATIEAMWKVFDDMKNAPVTDQELADAKMRVAGGMVMDMQTIGQQAGRRVDAILNDYPIDYYDTYPQRVAQVKAPELQDVLKKYVDENRMIIVVAAPAEKVKAQLEKLGEVKVIPMPAKAAELLKSN